MTNADVHDRNVGDLISRRAAIDALEREQSLDERPITETRWFDLGLKKAQDILSGMPSAQPETAKRIVGKSRGGITLWYQCDMCNEPVDAQDNFCRGCGRRFEHGSNRQTGGD